MTYCGTSHLSPCFRGPRAAWRIGAWLLVLAANTSVAQPSNESLQFERIDAGNGLSNNVVTALLQDQRGFLWIGTSDGLNRYDGYEFVTYRSISGDSSSLSSSSITALQEEASGDIWVGTTKGMNRFDPTTGTARRFIQDLRIASLYAESDSSLWVSTGYRIMRYDPRRDETTLYWSSDPPMVKEVEASSLASHDESGFAFAFIAPQEDGAASSTVRVLQYSAAADALVERWTRKRSGGALHFFTRHNRVWLGSHDPGYVDLRSGGFNPVANWPNGATINFAFEARDSVAWLMSDRGVARYDEVTEELTFHALESGATAGLSGTALSMLEDRAGIVWVGTRSGLYKHDPNVKPFISVGPGSGLPDEPGAGTVMAIAEAADETLDVGTFGAGLLRVNTHTATTIGSTVWALHYVGADLWAGSSDGLFVRRGGAAQPFERVRLPVPDSTVGQPVVFDISPGSEGTLLVAGHRDVHRVDVKSGRVISTARIYRPDLPGVSDQFVSCQSVAIDEAGTIWIGTEGAGLARIDPASDALSFVEGTAGMTVYDVQVARAAAGTLWLATDRGLLRYDTIKTTPAVSLTGDALVFSVIETAPHELWLGTSRGIAHVKPGGDIRYFDEADGTGNTEYNRRAAIRRNNGELVFGGLNGLTLFVPDDIGLNTHASPATILSVRTASRDTAIDHNALGLEELTVGYRDYQIAIVFAAPDFGAPDRTLYRYRLRGLDDRWTDAGHDRSVNYTNLSPGRYTFEVASANLDGVDAGVGDAIEIIIRPLVHQTWYFKIAVAALVAALLFLAYRYRVARLVALERMRLRIAADLHDDIGSRLSGLALLSDVVGNDSSLTTESRSRLDHISEGARQMVDTLRDIVWFVHPSNDDSAVLIDRMTAVAQELLPGIDFELITPDARVFDRMDMQQRRNVFLVFKEAITNVARHAGARSVRVTLTNNPALSMQIADDGIGFGDDGGLGGHGLKNMAWRAQQVGASLEIVSRPTGGTSVTLDFNSTGRQ